MSARRSSQSSIIDGHGFWARLRFHMKAQSFVRSQRHPPARPCVHPQLPRPIPSKAMSCPAWQVLMHTSQHRFARTSPQVLQIQSGCIAATFPVRTAVHNDTRLPVHLHCVPSPAHPHETKVPVPSTTRCPAWQILAQGGQQAGVPGQVWHEYDRTGILSSLSAAHFPDPNGTHMHWYFPRPAPQSQKNAE
jgi:hypothetical protein